MEELIFSHFKLISSKSHGDWCWYVVCYAFLSVFPAVLCLPNTPPDGAVADYCEAVQDKPVLCIIGIASYSHPARVLVWGETAWIATQPSVRENIVCVYCLCYSTPYLQIKRGSSNMESDPAKTL